MAQWDEKSATGNGGMQHNTGPLAGRDDMDEVMERARAEVDRYVTVAADFIRERPLASLAGAVAIGFLIGKIASRR